MEQFGVLTLGSRLKRLSDHLFLQVQELYHECNIPISSSYFPILRLLQSAGSLSVVEIAERLNLSHPAVSKQITKILKTDLLEKTQDEHDQRRSLLRLSVVGVSAMNSIEPILAEMKIILEQSTSFSSNTFMEALAVFEESMLTDSLTQKVLDRLGPFKIVPLSPAHEVAFREINMAWLVKYFPDQITQYDHYLLNNPQRHLIDKGASVWVAVRQHNNQETVLGTVVLLPKKDEKWGKILKLAVIEHCQGKGIAQALLTQLISVAGSTGMTKLTLETASCLTAAAHLYDKNGFVEMQKPSVSHYERANVYMEKQL